MLLHDTSAFLLAATLFNCCRAIQIDGVLPGHRVSNVVESQVTSVPYSSSNSIHPSFYSTIEPAPLETRTAHHHHHRQNDKPSNDSMSEDIKCVKKFCGKNPSFLWPVIKIPAKGLRKRTDAASETPTTSVVSVSVNATQDVTGVSSTQVETPSPIAPLSNGDKYFIPKTKLGTYIPQFHLPAKHLKERNTILKTMPAGLTTSTASPKSSSSSTTEGSGAADLLHKLGAFLGDNSKIVSAASVSDSAVFKSKVSPTSTSTSTWAGPVVNPGDFHRIAGGLVRPRTRESYPTATVMSTLEGDISFVAQATHRAATGLFRRHKDRQTSSTTTSTSPGSLPSNKKQAHMIPHLPGVHLPAPVLGIPGISDTHRNLRHSTATRDLHTADSVTSSSGSVTTERPLLTPAHPGNYFSFNLSDLTTVSAAQWGYAHKPAPGLFLPVSSMATTLSSLRPDATGVVSEHVPTYVQNEVVKRSDEPGSTAASELSSAEEPPHIISEVYQAAPANSHKNAAGLRIRADANPSSQLPQNSNTEGRSAPTETPLNAVYLPAGSSLTPSTLETRVRTRTSPCSSVIVSTSSDSTLSESLETPGLSFIKPLIVLEDLSTISLAPSAIPTLTESHWLPKQVTFFPGVHRHAQGLGRFRRAESTRTAGVDEDAWTAKLLPTGNPNVHRPALGL